MEEWMLGEKYKVVEEIGAGGGGRVFKVYDCQLDRIWAAKRIGQGSQAMEEQILQSVESLFSVRIVDRVEQEGEGYLIMDWIEGESLQQRIDRKGALSIPESLQIGITVCKAYEQLHAMEPPVLYLDCKPSNIMLEKRGRILLVDFGSAVRKGETETLPIAGSVGYAAPEQRRAQQHLRQVDERSDIYSLGKTLYAALGGQCPDKPPYGAQRLRRVNGTVPGSLCSIVEKCFESDPGKRYQTAAALRRALEEYEHTEMYRRWIWRGAWLLLLTVLLCSAWELAGGILYAARIAGISKHGNMRSVFNALMRTWQQTYFFQKGLFWFFCSCAVRQIYRKYTGKKGIRWEMKQSVLRTMKKQGSWCILLLGLLIFGMPAAGKAAESTPAACPENISGREMTGKDTALFGLRDKALRRLLIREGTVLETEERIYIELDPSLFSENEVYTISVLGVDEDGEEEKMSFLYQPVDPQR